MSAPGSVARSPEVAQAPVRWRDDFPILSTTVRGKPLVYLDNAATTQKPRRVIDAVSDYYASGNANIHRGVHYLSDVVAGWLGAIVWVTVVWAVVLRGRGAHAVPES